MVNGHDENFEFGQVDPEISFKDIKFIIFLLTVQAEEPFVSFRLMALLATSWVNVQIFQNPELSKLGS